MTPLFDALQRIVAMAEARDAERTVIVVTGQTIASAPGHLAAAMTVTARESLRYADTGDAMRYSVEDRRESGEERVRKA